MLPELNNEDFPKCPSVLILTDPQADLKGRFGRGKRLGWLKQRSEIQDNLASDNEPDGDLALAGAMGGEEEEKPQRITMAIPMSSDRALSQLREQSVSPVTSISEIKQIAADYSKRFGVPIVITSEMGNNRHVDAMACMEAGRIKVHLHPLLQYRDRAYIESAILSAVEECRDFQKQRAFGWQRG